MNSIKFAVWTMEILLTREFRPYYINILYPKTSTTWKTHFVRKDKEILGRVLFQGFSIFWRCRDWLNVEDSANDVENIKKYRFHRKNPHFSKKNPHKKSVWWVILQYVKQIMFDIWIRPYYINILYPKNQILLWNKVCEDRTGRARLRSPVFLWDCVWV